MIASLAKKKLDYKKYLQRFRTNVSGTEHEDSFSEILDKIQKLEMEINDKANNLIENQHV